MKFSALYTEINIASSTYSFYIILFLLYFKIWFALVYGV
jgi:hypothetical protein